MQVQSEHIATCPNYCKLFQQTIIKRKYAAVICDSYLVVYLWSWTGYLAVQSVKDDKNQDYNVLIWVVPQTPIYHLGNY